MISFIIPVYNNFELTKQCVESLHASIDIEDYEAIIVDDASEGETSTLLDSLADNKTRITHCEENGGYAKANNIGAKQAKGEILFLLNNDLVLSTGWIQPMLKALYKPSVGIVGNVQLNAKTGEIDHTGYLFDGLGNQRHNRQTNKGIFGIPSYSKYHAVTGACMGIRKSLYLELGGLNEEFENGCEDIDLCFRIQKRGLKVLVANKSIVNHHVSATRGDSTLRDEKNARILQKHWRNRIARISAESWPKDYLSQIKENREAYSWTLYRQAMLRRLGVVRSPAPAGMQIVESKLSRNERHWKSIIEGKNDEEIKMSYLSNKGDWHDRQFNYKGLEINRNAHPGRWIKEKATLTLSEEIFISKFSIQGTIREVNDEVIEGGDLGLKITVNQTMTKVFHPIEQGAFEATIEEVPTVPNQQTQIDVELLGVHKTNAYAYLGRITRKWFLLPKKLRRHWKLFREQNKNQRLIIERIQINGESFLDYKERPSAPANFDFLRKYVNLGINLVGWFKAELGVGESVRLAAKALDTTNIQTSLVPLKVNCLAAQGDSTYAERLTDENPYSINVFHIDPAQCGDIDHHHGEHFRKNKKNIAYWAWELPSFPEQWIRYFQYFDEIWAPSGFTAESIVMKSPIPVIKIPHCIDFAIPNIDHREKLRLPNDRFLFLFAYDLNSYQERKNPKAIIEAYKAAFSGNSGNDVGLVIKTHSKDKNPKAFGELQDHLDGIENCHLIDETLSRSEVYSLMAAVDCYVSLHRSEGFGLTVAESMYIGKPVISTNWSATAEFLDNSCGCPVKYNLIELDKSHGPYEKGQIWADPDPMHAAEYMLKLVNDSEYAQRIGEQAALQIRSRFSPNQIGNLYEERLKSMALW